jgi:hypothetical protein
LEIYFEVAVVREGEKPTTAINNAFNAELIFYYILIELKLQ